jgi:RimJ/RimL family protein N-acetyltransferase
MAPEFPLRVAARADPVVLETQRLALHRLARDDAPFIHELLNDPDWIRYIGDKGVRSLEDARRYIENGPMKMYAEHGHGLWLVRRKRDHASLGICGLIKRPQLASVDLGFAFLPPYRSQGYARESAEGVLRHGRKVLGLERVVAITSPANVPSATLLARLGFVYENTFELAPNDPVMLYAWRPRRWPRISRNLRGVS